MNPWLLGSMAAGLVLRVGMTLALWERMPPLADEGVYLMQGGFFLALGEFETGAFVRPPLYFAVVAGAWAIADALGLRVVLVVKLLQCVAGTLVAIPIHRTARRVGGPRVARVAVLFAMFDPTLVAYCHLVWPETFMLLGAAIVFDGVAGIENRSRLQQAALGALTGLLLLLKPVFGLFTLLLALHWLRRLGPRRAAALVLVVGGTAALVVSPWVVRNQLRYGPAIVIENQGPYNLWSGNAPIRPDQVLKQWRELPDPLTRSRVGTERGLAAITADPLGFVWNACRRALNLWGLEFFVVRHAVIGGYGEVTPGAFLLLFWLVQLGWALTLTSAAAGARSAVRDPTLRLLVGYAVCFTLLVSAMVATTRFRVPLALPLCVAAGLGVDRALAGRLRRSDLVLVATALAVLLISLANPLFRTLASADLEALGSSKTAPWRFFRY